MVTGGASAREGGAGDSGYVATPPPAPDSCLPARKASENRRSNKPIMEKRRRARINNCLNELKTLILDAMKKDPARHSKLEKADILEMTVKHLETLQRQQVAMSAATDPAVLNKFRAGFSECAGEVGRFPGLDSPVRRRLLQHLANCLNGTSAAAADAPPQPPPAAQPAPVQVHILPTTATAEVATSGGIFFTTGSAEGSLQLVPTRLSNGDIALVLPSTGNAAAHLFRQVGAARAPSPTPSVTSSASSSPLPLLVPIPSRTASTASASSTSSSCASTTQQVVSRDVATSPAFYQKLDSSPSPHNSFHHSPSDDLPMAYSPPLQKPLALVIRKSSPPVADEKPWRPW